jgi:hypothetical protein
MDKKKLLTAAAAFTIISLAIYMAGAMLDMPYYTDAANARLWSPAMMPSADASPPLSFLLLSAASTFLTGILLSYLYSICKNSFNSNKPFKNDKALMVGAKFGLFVFLLLPLGAFLSMYMLLAIPIGLNFSWLAQGLLSSVLGSMAIAKILS